MPVHTMPSLFEMAKELEAAALDGEIHNPKHQKFIKELCMYLSEDDEYAVEELSEEQIKYLNWLFDGYCNDEWEPYDEYLES